jgi:hypothetical protein
MGNILLNNADACCFGKILTIIDLGATHGEDSPKNHELINRLG